jgi:acyl-CoA thioester hydrolase
MIHHTRFPVRYAETDQMGVVHHSVAVVWYEQGRTEFMASLGYPYGEMERRGCFMPIVEMGARFRSPARYEDPIRVETRITKVSGARIRFEYRALHDEEDRVLHEGFTLLGCMNAEGRPIRMPDEIRAACRDAMEAAE